MQTQQRIEREKEEDRRMKKRKEKRRKNGREEREMRENSVLYNERQPEAKVDFRCPML